MRPEFTPHALLRLAHGAALVSAAAVPPWVQPALERAPWVVVRRARGARLIPVGVRGATRAERLAAWLEPDEILECVCPAQLAARRPAAAGARRAQLPAFAVLDAIDALMRARGLAWGPCGSVGFELASGMATVTEASDLDLLVEAGEPLPVAAAAALHAALEHLPVRVDVQVEGPHGAVALAEYAAGRGPVVLRTVDGPRLVHDPWVTAPAAA
jgi:phosphoribosyl-dephospho-CoA transferase